VHGVVPRGNVNATEPSLVFALLQDDAIVNVLKLNSEQQLYINYATNDSRLEAYTSRHTIEKVILVSK